MGIKAPEYTKVDVNAKFEERFLVTKRSTNRVRITDRYTDTYVYVCGLDVEPVLKEVRFVLEHKISHDRFRETRWDTNPRIASIVSSFILPNDTFHQMVRTGNSMINRQLWWDYFLGKYKDYETYKSIALTEKETIQEVNTLKKEQCRAKRKGTRRRADLDTM